MRFVDEHSDRYAVALLLRVLDIPPSTYTLATRNNLARWQGEAGDVAGAAAAYDALLTDYLRVLGPDHPDTLATPKQPRPMAGSGTTSATTLVAPPWPLDRVWRSYQPPPIRN